MCRDACADVEDVSCHEDQVQVQLPHLRSACLGSGAEMAGFENEVAV